MRSVTSSGAFLGAALVAAIGFCAVPVDANEIEGGFSDPSRVVAIGGSITEIVYALGEEKRLVARDSTSLYPEAALALPDVGYMRQLSPEGVLSVNPSAILMLEGSGPREAVDVLAKASAEMVNVPDRFDHDGILEKIRIVGMAIGAEGKAKELASLVDKDIKSAQELTADVAERKRVLFVLSLQGGKILAAGHGTAADGIIKMAGAVNVMGDFEGYKQASDEAVVTAKPDVILMMTRGGEHDRGVDEVVSHPAIAPTPAGQAKALIRMDASYLLGFGPRTAGAVRDLAKAFYGDKATD
ncbi:hemin ABC transporter substrate-binding protein [Mesorhizobium sp. L-8-10]|uniref:heme/hemin ABC transporter substrate-binding protein n=1 Tax=Mesorhizobium sp. L-8-10 TaxID=2744523 RepID=UPI001925816B|nr:hemin ABC transporter substrate-binding protein [Mesorhizobium sp. L-8-10]BCH32174.1 hemin ABC transporter substrate-binding protein [Mesorhizobium sp. L-8-10]